MKHGRMIELLLPNNPMFLFLLLLLLLFLLLLFLLLF